MKDISRRVAQQITEARTRLERCSRLLCRIRPGSHQTLVAALRNEVADLAIEVQRTEAADRAYDERFREANEDMTGQDLDLFVVGE